VAAGKSVRERARIVIAADGALSRMRRLMGGAHPAPRRYFAVQEWVEADEPMPHFTSIFDSRISDYYCWTIPKGDVLLIGAALAPKNHASAKFAELKSSLREYGFCFGETVKREGAFILRPVRPSQIMTAADGIGFIGEAGGFISPSSAEGFSYAFKSALLMSQALSSGPDGFERRYRRLTRSLRFQLWGKNVKAQVIYGRRSRALLMRTGIGALSIHSGAGNCAGA
jgi:flavin-dependent dehydrogenase